MVHKRNWFSLIIAVAIYFIAACPAQAIRLPCPTTATIITTPVQLAAMSSNLAGSYCLGGNVDMKFMSWTPIGSDATPFTGSFYGRDYEISNLTLPLFGTIGATGRVRFVTILNPKRGYYFESCSKGALAESNSGKISSVKSFRFCGAYYASSIVGGLVGTNTQTGLIEWSSSSGMVSLNGSGLLGGLVGENFGIIQYSYSTSTVVGGTDAVFSNGAGTCGGLVGTNSGTIRNSFSTGNVTCHSSYERNVGGLVGMNYGKIVESFSLGKVTLSGWYGAAGGLIGVLWSDDQHLASVEQSFSTGAVSSSYRIGGLVGRIVGTTISNSNYWDVNNSGQETSAAGVGLTTETLKSELPIGFSLATWGIIPTRTYPYFLTYKYSTVELDKFKGRHVSQVDSSSVDAILTFLDRAILVYTENSNCLGGKNFPDIDVSSNVRAQLCPLDSEGVGSFTLAFRGTSITSSADLISDLDQLINGEAVIPTEHYQAAISTIIDVYFYLKDQGISTSGLTLVGHSLGGGLAQFAAANSPIPIKRVVTFNSAGLSKGSLAALPGTASAVMSTTEFIHVVNNNDYVPTFGAHFWGQDVIHVLGYNYSAFCRPLAVALLNPLCGLTLYKNHSITKLKMLIQAQRG